MNGRPPKPDPGPGEAREIAHVLRLLSRGYFCVMTGGIACYWPTDRLFAGIALAAITIVFLYLAFLALVLAATGTRNILARTFGLQQNPILGRCIGFAILAAIVGLGVILFRVSGGLFQPG